MQISLPTSELFWMDNYHTYLIFDPQVNTNGIISFATESLSFESDTFPLNGDKFRIVAPYWADVDLWEGGEVFYRVSSTNAKLLQQASDDVTSVYSDLKGFQAKWILVATWYNVPFYGAYDSFIEIVREILFK